jgi:hypothetical protein
VPYWSRTTFCGATWKKVAPKCPSTAQAIASAATPTIPRWNRVSGPPAGSGSGSGPATSAELGGAPDVGGPPEVPAFGQCISNYRALALVGDQRPVETERLLLRPRPRRHREGGAARHAVLNRSIQERIRERAPKRLDLSPEGTVTRAAGGIDGEDDLGADQRDLVLVAPGHRFRRGDRADAE